MIYLLSTTTKSFVTNPSTFDVGLMKQLSYCLAKQIATPNIGSTHHIVVVPGVKYPYSKVKVKDQHKCYLAEVSKVEKGKYTFVKPAIMKQALPEGVEYNPLKPQDSLFLFPIDKSKSCRYRVVTDGYLNSADHTSVYFDYDADTKTVTVCDFTKPVFNIYTASDAASEATTSEEPTLTDYSDLID